MRMNGSQILVEVLLEQSVDTIFGYPGGAVLNIYDALYKNQHRIKHILTAHEQGASHAADGYARATGKTGVVLATSGPGATNLVTGIATAYMDSIPMVAITGNVSSELIGWDSFQEVYITGITMPITKHNFVVRRVEELADILRDAFRIANSDRPGPVLVDIPKDITAAECEYTPKVPLAVTKNYDLGDDTLEEIAKVINQAQKPVIFFGGGVVASGASESLGEFMSKATIPACHTMMGTGAIGYGEKLNLGLIGMHGSISSSYAMKDADVVVAIGTRFSDRVATDKHNFAKNAHIIHIDIDAAEINKNIHIHQSVVGDVKEVLENLLPFIESNDHKEWLTQIEAWQKDDYKPEDLQGVLRPHQIIKKVSDLAGEDAIFATDVGQHQMWAAQYCRRTKARSFLTSGGLGTMGFGYGAAMGAKVAQPTRTVIHITGDGSFHMNLNELCTAVSYNIPVITVLLNNSVLGMVRQWQASFYEHRYSSTDLYRKTDYVKLAEAFGAKGFRCTTIEELDSAMQEALAANCPCVIECIIDKDERILPLIPTGKSVDDVIIE